MTSLPPTRDYRDAALAHGLARIGLGINIALHGWTRIPNLGGFAQSLRQQFAHSPLPGGLVEASAYVIVFVEAVVGVLLIVGWFQRVALVAGALLMWLLLFGACLLQNWEMAAVQLPYLAFYAVLLATLRHDWYSIDSWRWRKRIETY